MARVLVVYGTTEGQTAKIAAHIGDTARRLGHDVAVRHAPDLDGEALDEYEAIVAGASLHEGRYQRAVRDFVERNTATLRSRPSAFFSVSLAAASRDPDEQAEPLRIAQRFTADLGWAPARIASFAGALKYTQYSWLKRMLMKQIAQKEGGETDTSRDHEYTDWEAVTRFVEELSSELWGGVARSV